MEKENKSVFLGENDKFRIHAWSAPGKLYVWSPYPAEIYLYAMDGELCTRLELAAGRSETPVPSGTYVVCVGSTSFKMTF